ncbi:hypothetical protein Tco_0922061 [Tanacetum coccineum]|uniref:Uncharacterized protein n=1 Tax=Tanacetum coccineum TaxID=301880 RepID=A0ABQ5CYQ5_9ASTR
MTTESAIALAVATKSSNLEYHWADIFTRILHMENDSDIHSPRLGMKEYESQSHSNGLQDDTSCLSSSNKTFGSAFWLVELSAFCGDMISQATFWNVFLCFWSLCIRLEFCNPLHESEPLVVLDFPHYSRSDEQIYGLSDNGSQWEKSNCLSDVERTQANPIFRMLWTSCVCVCCINFFRSFHRVPPFSIPFTSSSSGTSSDLTRTKDTVVSWMNNASISPKLL